MVCFLYIVVGIFAAVYALFDLSYFARILFIKISTILVPRRKKRLDEEVNTYGFCTTNDVDILLTHMNNARFLRELDFARYNMYHRTGLYETVVSRGGTVLQAASTIRYRKPLPIFSFFRVSTKLAYWDERSYYIEQKFITISDNFVRAIAISKQTVLNLNISLLEVNRLIDPEIRRPDQPEDLVHWLAYNEASSQRLKKSR